MNKRMNKEELLELLKTLKVDKEEFWILSSSALVLRGIFKDAGDLDIAVTSKGLQQLKDNYDIKPKNEKWYKVSDNIEAVCDGEKDGLKYQPEKVGDYYLQNINEYHNYLLNSSREKDIARIPLVEKYIRENNK